MNKRDILVGMVIGLAASLAGCFLFVIGFTEYGFSEGIAVMKAEEKLGKLLTLGAILNLLCFFALLYLKKDLMARGVILATILLAIITLFI